MPHPDLITQFRPIGLCNVVYKILSKIIVSRIQPLLPNLVGTEQASFVPGRNIIDNVVIVQEIIHSMRVSNSKKKFMAIIVDLDKAYDIVKWSFLREYLFLLASLGI